MPNHVLLSHLTLRLAATQPNMARYHTNRIDNGLKTPNARHEQAKRNFDEMIEVTVPASLIISPPMRKICPVLYLLLEPPRFKSIPHITRAIHRISSTLLVFICPIIRIPLGSWGIFLLLENVAYPEWIGRIIVRYEVREAFSCARDGLWISCYYFTRWMRRWKLPNITRDNESSPELKSSIIKPCDKQTSPSYSQPWKFHVSEQSTTNPSRDDALRARVDMGAPW